MRDVSELPAFVDDDEPTGVLGTLKEMPVAEVVQALAQAMKDALVEVKPKGEPLGVIGVERGRVVYAQSGDLVGEAAFFRLFCAHRGAFRIRYGRRAEQHNVDRDPTWLLLEGARLLDEERACRPVFDTPPDGTPFAVQRSAAVPAPPEAPRRNAPFSGFFDEAGVTTAPPIPLPVEAQRFHSLHVLGDTDEIIDDVERMDSDRTLRERRRGPAELTPG